MNGVNAVRQVFCLCKAVFVAGEIITLGIFGGVISACGFQEHLKFSACLRRFKLCFAVVRMLNQSDIALDNLLGHIVSGGIVFYGVVFGLRADMVCGFVKQITLAGTDFTHRPIITADIIFCGELTVCVGGISVNKLLALVNAVNRTAKRCVTLCCACFFIALGDGDIPFFQNVGKTLVCDLVPFNRCRLIIRNNITDCGIDFFQNIACSDQHITEICLARTVGYGVFVHRKPRKRGAGQVKFHALV